MARELGMTVRQMMSGVAGPMTVIEERLWYALYQAEEEEREAQRGAM